MPGSLEHWTNLAPIQCLRTLSFTLMCGIVGKISASGVVDRELLETMCGLIEHRGPDSRGTFLENGVSLGIQRLAIQLELKLRTYVDRIAVANPLSLALNSA